jgi:hypothetical protein
MKDFPELATLSTLEIWNAFLISEGYLKIFMKLPLESGTSEIRAFLRSTFPLKVRVPLCLEDDFRFLLV